MKNLIIKNWFKISIVLILSSGVAILLWHTIFYNKKYTKKLTCEEQVLRCLELGSDKRAQACLSLFGIDYKLDNINSALGSLVFREVAVKKACEMPAPPPKLPKIQIPTNDSK